MINSTRLRNYKSLLVQFRSRPDQAGLPEHGLLTRFANHAGVSVRYLSHINNGRKNIGEAVSRQLEAGMELPEGWMDAQHDGANGMSTAELDFSETALELFRESPADAQAMLMRYMLERIRVKTR